MYEIHVWYRFLQNGYCLITAYLIIDFIALVKDICSRESQEDGSWCDLVEKAGKLAEKVMAEVQQNPNQGIMEQVMALLFSHGKDDKV